MASELELRTLRKITYRIIPFVMLLYFIAFVDRVNMGFAALTMNKQLGFSPGVFGFGAGIFFLGYFLFEVPSNVILHKVGARIWIARVMITWGLVSGCMIFVHGATSFYILRFLLGVAEAGFFPGVILYLELLVSGAQTCCRDRGLYGGGTVIDRAWLADFRRVIGNTWPVRLGELANDVPSGSAAGGSAWRGGAVCADRPAREGGVADGG